MNLQECLARDRYLWGRGAGGVDFNFNLSNFIALKSLLPKLLFSWVCTNF